MRQRDLVEIAPKLDRARLGNQFPQIRGLRRGNRAMGSRQNDTIYVDTWLQVLFTELSVVKIHNLGFHYRHEVCPGQTGPLDLILERICHHYLKRKTDRRNDRPSAL